MFRSFIGENGMSDFKTLGICSNCGGKVVLFIGPWMGVNSPTPGCQDCGATPKSHLPVIETVLPENKQTFLLT